VALTGSLYNGKCYADSASATVALYVSPAFMNFSNGSTGYFTTPSFSGSTVNIQGWTLTSGSYAYRYTTGLPTPTFPPCDPAADFKDGVTIGWGIALAMVVAFGIRMLQRGF
jgi:hypothetical protein